MLDYQIRFCTSSDGTRIGYAVIGEGPPIINIPGWVGSHDELQRAEAREYVSIIGEGHTFIWISPRGTSSSQRDVGPVTLEQSVADVRAVAASAGVSRCAIIGNGDGATTAVMIAVETPELVSKLVLLGPSADGHRLTRAEEIESFIALVNGNWALARRAMAAIIFPRGPADEQVWLARMMRDSISPEVAAAYVRLEREFNVTELLPRISAPTLVLTSSIASQVRRIQQSREVAAMIPNARFATHSGANVPYLGEGQQAARIIREFLVEGEQGGASKVAPAEGVTSGTAVILFADIVDSTALVERIGNAAFRDRSRELEGALRTAIGDEGGAPVEGRTLGDGVLGVFNSAAQAISAAMSCARAADRCALALHLGLHAGDVLRESGNVYGMAVNVASRIAGLSGPNEILVSGTVRDLARASALLVFEDRGEHALKGVADPVRVFAVRAE